MTDKPILFSAPMVRALLAGRKTQTRRIITKKAALDALSVFGPSFLLLPGNVDLLPYAVGNRLWVREGFNLLSFGDYAVTKYQPCDIRYAATERLAKLPADIRGYPWRPSIHMPRWASRLTLVVTDVLVQRLHDISEADAVAEGILVGEPLAGIPDSDGDIYHDGATDKIDGWTRSPVEAYRNLWNHINGPGAWNANPWVTAISFTVHQCNIDKMAV